MIYLDIEIYLTTEVDVTGRDIWSPEQYAEYGDHRKRPYRELLARIGAENPRVVTDLGCGPGDMTVELARRWQDATVTGIDNSPAMIEAARGHASDRVSFRTEDIGAWRPDEPQDVIVSNAALHWVPGHLGMLPRWIAALNPGGWLAFQVPGNFDAPSHALLRELCDARGLGGTLLKTPVAEPGRYLETLVGAGCAVDAWETTYQQVLSGHDAVLEWTRGTALRPVLARLADPAEREDFVNQYGKLLAEAYPERPYGTVYPFRRIFVVARKDARRTA
jgi:trans-aconitate 2-methyltransferase